MNNILYVLCFNDNTMQMIKSDEYYNLEFKKPLMIETTRWLENIMYKKWLRDNIDQWNNADFVGTISYKAKERLVLSDSLDKLIEEGKNADVIVIYPAKKGSLLSFAGGSHPGFVQAWILLMHALNIPLQVSYDTTPFYCNYWMARPEWMKKYMEFFDKAIEALENEPLKSMVWMNSGYGGNMPIDDRLRIFGKTYYPLYIFILERLPSVFFAFHQAKMHYNITLAPSFG